MDSGKPVLVSLANADGAPVPIPVSSTLRDSIMRRLDDLPPYTLAVEVEATRADGSVRVAALLKLNRGWSFSGWVDHSPEDDAVGIRVSKTFGVK